MLNTAEILTSEGWKMFEPGLVEGVYYHCMVLVNKSSVMLIGGSTEESFYSVKTYFYNFDTKGWTEGPKLNRSRSHHSCGMIKKDKDSDEVSNKIIFSLLLG